VLPISQNTNVYCDGSNVILSIFHILYHHDQFNHIIKYKCHESYTIFTYDDELRIGLMGLFYSLFIIGLGI
jgi:hypothetical protein